jgi:hypothetical protein
MRRKIVFYTCVPVIIGILVAALSGTEQTIFTSTSTVTTESVETQTITVDHTSTVMSGTKTVTVSQPDSRTGKSPTGSSQHSGAQGGNSQSPGHTTNTPTSTTSSGSGTHQSNPTSSTSTSTTTTPKGSKWPSGITGQLPYEGPFVANKLPYTGEGIEIGRPIEQVDNKLVLNVVCTGVSETEAQYEVEELMKANNDVYSAYIFRYSS